ncbi:hypothetical protein D0Z07_2605 [Hyphodiscus hymeniophilus]|uniref:Uncharacterized protein n=1 Tax=Hyphodiscus hymeniophilus TaxID=353542 RepID=A0A9P6VMK1_9HELO|nr:hypothetical protein D0Z07_2605 [Hyphodiscus hymeniophilus]
MPKFPKSFGRRKSTANVFEDVQEAPVVEHSFKVFERPDGGSKSFDGGIKLSKTMPVGRPKTSSKVEDNMFEHLSSNRGSGASNTNTASTTDNSSRLSAASTAPSSTDIQGREEHRSPNDKSFNDIPVPPIPKSATTFSLKSAGRSLSWGRNTMKSSTPPPIKELPGLPQMEPDPSAGRSRPITASTATAPKLDEEDLGLSLGGDFGDMFSGFDKRKSAVLLQQEHRAMSQSPEILPTGPASRSYSSNHYNQPSRLNIDKNKDVEPSPYSWSSQHSQEALISNSSPPPFAPRNEAPPPPVPRHTSPTSTRQQRLEPVADTGSRGSVQRQSTVDYDEDARLLRESFNASQKLNEPSYSPQVRDSWALPSDKPYDVDDSTMSSGGMASTNATPRARKPLPNPESYDELVLDDHIVTAANLAERFQEQPVSPPTQFTPRNKIMTPAQFERYKQDQERLRNLGGKPADEEDDEDEEHYEDEMDDAEKAKQLAKQRRKQEAHMAVYRQQMMKVTGEAAATGPPRPAVYATQSTPDLANLGKAEEGEEEDEEVPLAILQAHGFPNKNKPPMRSAGSNPNLRAQAIGAGSDGRLPVFARHLPQDPYFGAGIVNPAHRESLAFGGGAGSVSGSPTRGLPPGGLVGVIATEERSRAMRRGSPNPQGEYGPVPSPSNGFNGMGIPPNAAMMNGMGPMGPMGMNPLMMTPGDQAQIQMSQQMQQFMQMQMQFMQMMTSGQGPPPQNGHIPQQSIGQMPSPGNPSLRPSSSHQRAMTMMDPNSAPWLPQGSMYAPSIRMSGAGYAPSIAPSERSNVGLPGRYRPVSHAVPQENQSRTSTMSGAIQGWENKNGSATIKPVKKSGNISDEDDEEGWEEMSKKREKKKSTWRTKKETNGFKDLLGFSQL